MATFLGLGYNLIKVPFFLKTEADTAEEAEAIIKASIKERAGIEEDAVTMAMIIDITGALDTDKQQN